MPRGRCLRPAAAPSPTDEVQFLREGVVGFAHRYCTKTSRAAATLTICVGAESVYHLKMKVARGQEKTPVVPKWPGKVAARRTRAHDRNFKMEVCYGLDSVIGFDSCGAEAAF